MIIDPPDTHMDTQEDTFSTYSTSLVKEQIESLLHDPKKCCSILEFFLEHIDVIRTLPPKV
jgi:hypothetical protein